MQPFDVVTLAEALEKRGAARRFGGMPYLAEIDRNTASAANAVHYARIVRFNSVLRQLIDGRHRDRRPRLRHRRVAAQRRSSTTPRPRSSRSPTRCPRQRRFRPHRGLAELAVDRIDELFERDEPITGLPTGFTDFDMMTSGLQPSDLVIVAGRPSMGKTTFAMNIAENVAIKTRQGRWRSSAWRCPGDSLAMRMMSSLGRIDQHRVRTGKLRGRRVAAADLGGDHAVAGADVHRRHPGPVAHRAARPRRAAR